MKCLKKIGGYLYILSQLKQCLNLSNVNIYIHDQCTKYLREGVCVCKKVQCTLVSHRLMPYQEDRCLFFCLLLKLSNSFVTWSNRPAKYHFKAHQRLLFYVRSNLTGQSVLGSLLYSIPCLKSQNSVFILIRPQSSQSTCLF